MLGTDKGISYVIVRAYADEPVKLLAVGQRPGCVLVAKTEAGVTIGFPYESVYDFDPERYRSLRQAFETNDRHALMSLWREARRGW